ncbi:MAG: hypothetical protein QOG10_3598 [Kribbellaceae bacterium]|nr:hypothetical protein [Kribbellaceae bacterium]
MSRRGVAAARRVEAGSVSTAAEQLTAGYGCGKERGRRHGQHGRTTRRRVLHVPYRRADRWSTSRTGAPTDRARPVPARRRVVHFPYRLADGSCTSRTGAPYSGGGSSVSVRVVSVCRCVGTGSGVATRRGIDGARDRRTDTSARPHQRGRVGNDPGARGCQSDRGEEPHLLLSATLARSACVRRVQPAVGDRAPVFPSTRSGLTMWLNVTAPDVECVARGTSPGADGRAGAYQDRLPVV